VAHDPKIYAAIDKTPMFDNQVDFDQDRSTNDLIIHQHQHIPDSFLSDLKSQKMASGSQRCGDMMLALTVPVGAIEDMWTNYGFDAMNGASIAEVRKMLQRLELDTFIATNKAI
jgi:hypothetical protein